MSSVDVEATAYAEVYLRQEPMAAGNDAGPDHRTPTRDSVRTQHDPVRHRVAVHLERSAVAQHDPATPGVRASRVRSACKSGIGEARVVGPPAIEVGLQDPALAIWDDLPAGGDVNCTCRVGDERNEEHRPQERRLHEHLLGAQYARRPTEIKAKTPRRPKAQPRIAREENQTRAQRTAFWTLDAHWRLAPVPRPC